MSFTEVPTSILLIMGMTLWLIVKRTLTCSGKTGNTVRHQGLTSKKSCVAMMSMMLLCWGRHLCSTAKQFSSALAWIPSNVHLRHRAVWASTTNVLHSDTSALTYNGSYKDQHKTRFNTVAQVSTTQVRHWDFSMHSTMVSSHGVRFSQTWPKYTHCLQIYRVFFSWLWEVS